jgi:hypothetical protein
MLYGSPSDQLVDRGFEQSFPIDVQMHSFCGSVRKPQGHGFIAAPELVLPAETKRLSSV